MVRKCIAYNCDSYFRKGSPIRFYTFPNDPKLRKQWATATKRSFLPRGNFYLCSLHFEKSCFEEIAGLKRLKVDAVPSIFNFSSEDPFKKIRIIQKKMLIPKSQEQQSEKTEDIEIKYEPLAQSGSPGNFEVINVKSEPLLELSQEEAYNTEFSSIFDHAYCLKNETNDTFEESNIIKLKTSDPINLEPEPDSIKVIDNTDSGSILETLLLPSEQKVITQDIKERELKIANIASLTSVPEISLEENEELSNIDDTHSIESVRDSSPENEVITLSDEEVSTKSPEPGTQMSADPSNRPIKRRKFVKQQKYEYVGECDLIDFTSVESAMKNWDIALNQISEQKKQIEMLKKTNIKLKIRITSLEDLVKNLNQHIAKIT